MKSQSLLRQGRRSDSLRVSGWRSKTAVSIPSSSGQAFGRTSFVLDVAGRGLNPFFVRAGVRTKDRNAPRA